MLRKKDTEAKQLIKRVVEKTLELVKKEKQDLEMGNIMEQKKNPAVSEVNSERPSLEFRMQTCRYLIEL